MEYIFWNLIFHCFSKKKKKKLNLFCFLMITVNFTFILWTILLSWQYGFSSFVPFYYIFSFVLAKMKIHEINFLIKIASFLGYFFEGKIFNHASFPKCSITRIYSLKNTIVNIFKNWYFDIFRGKKWIENLFYSVMIKTVNFTFMYCYVELTSQGYFFERKIVNYASFSARLF